MNLRQAGWYWVSANGGVPEIAEWDAADRCWRSTYWYSVEGMASGRIVILSPRLTPPPPDAPAPPPDPSVAVRVATVRVVRAAAAYRTAKDANAHSRAPLYPAYWNSLTAALDALSVANAEAAEPGADPDVDTAGVLHGGDGT